MGLTDQSNSQYCCLQAYCALYSAVTGSWAGDLTPSASSSRPPSSWRQGTRAPSTNLSAEVQNALSELNADNTKYEPQNAAELLRLENSVQIFFVTSDGKVSTFSAPETLRIFQFSQDQADSTSTFLQVGGWTHPLIPGASPCLQAENGALMFPDIYSDLPDCSVGLVLMDGISEDIRADLVNLLS